jgi:hypothetical protein
MSRGVYFGFPSFYHFHCGGVKWNVKGAKKMKGMQPSSQSKVPAVLGTIDQQIKRLFQQNHGRAQALPNCT